MLGGGGERRWVWGEGGWGVGGGGVAFPWDVTFRGNVIASFFFSKRAAMFFKGDTVCVCVCVLKGVREGGRIVMCGCGKSGMFKAVRGGVSLVSRDHL